MRSTLLKHLLKRSFWELIIYFLVIHAIFAIVLIFAGCGDDGKSMPTAPAEEQVKVEVSVSKSDVRPGETVHLTASLAKPVQGEIEFYWINITGYGSLLSDNANTVSWVAPTNLTDVKVEIITVLVTILRHTVTTKSDGQVVTTTDVDKLSAQVAITIRG